MCQESKIRVIFERRLVNYIAFLFTIIIYLLIIIGTIAITQNIDNFISKSYPLVGEIIRITLLGFISLISYHYMFRSTIGTVIVEVGETDIRYSEIPDRQKSFIRSRSLIIAWDTVKAWQFTERYLSPFNISFNLNLDTVEFGKITVATDTFPYIKNKGKYASDFQSLLIKWLPAEKYDPSMFNRTNYIRYTFGYFLLSIPVLFFGFIVYAIIDDFGRLFELEFIGIIIFITMVSALCWLLGRSFIKDNNVVR